MLTTDKIKDGLSKKRTGFHAGQKVLLIISSRTELGYAAVVDGMHKGILYKNEVFQTLKVGQEIEGFIKKVREDGRLDLCLQKSGYKGIDALSKKIMDKLQQQDGFIAVTDNSRPGVIADLFGVSKKSFKRTIGYLYKKRLITLEKDGIRLRQRTAPKNAVQMAGSKIEAPRRKRRA
jgi:predicted RNA-binding protein (virulence factor B family)